MALVFKYMGLEYTYRSIAEQQVFYEELRDTIYFQNDRVLSPLSWLQLFCKCSTVSVCQTDTKKTAFGHHRPKNI